MSECLWRGGRGRDVAMHVRHEEEEEEEEAD